MVINTGRTSEFQVSCQHAPPSAAAYPSHTTLRRHPITHAPQADQPDTYGAYMTVSEECLPRAEFLEGMGIDTYRDDDTDTTYYSWKTEDAWYPAFEYCDDVEETYSMWVNTEAQWYGNAGVETIRALQQDRELECPPITTEGARIPWLIDYKVTVKTCTFTETNGGSFTEALGTAMAYSTDVTTTNLPIHDHHIHHHHNHAIAEPLPPFQHTASYFDFFATIFAVFVLKKLAGLEREKVRRIVVER